MILNSIGIISSVATCPAELISQTSLLSYYSLNGDTVSDGGSVTTTLTQVGSPTFGSGAFGQAIELNGTTQYMTGATTNLLEPTGGWSYSAWLSLENSTTDASIYDKWNTTTGIRILIRPAEAQRTILVSMSSQNIGFALPAGVFTTPAWHNVIFRRLSSSNTIQVYVDGVQLGSSGFTSFTASGQTLNLGRQRTSNSSFFDGKMDEISIWGRTLQSDEIAAISAGTCPLKS